MNGTLLQNFLDEAFVIWASGGWLMVPLFALTVFVYYTALDLFLRLNFHFLVQGRIHRLDDAQIEKGSSHNIQKAKELLYTNATSVGEVRRHFEEVRSEYLPIVTRRAKFLAILTGVSPLMGLLGTVTGMLSTFAGMSADGRAFNLIVEGISEALITTQTGLMIAIPALVVLSFIGQHRRRLMQAIARLERYNTRLVLRQNKQVSAAA
jgi:biopolymer transport protein ExbB